MVKNQFLECGMPKFHILKNQLINEFSNDIDLIKID